MFIRTLMWLLAKTATFATSKVFFTEVTNMANEMETANLKGTTRKEIVLTNLKDMGLEYATFIASMVIDIAVAWLRVQKGEPLKTTKED